MNLNADADGNGEAGAETEAEANANANASTRRMRNVQIVCQRRKFCLSAASCASECLNKKRQA